MMNSIPAKNKPREFILCSVCKNNDITVLELVLGAAIKNAVEKIWPSKNLGSTPELISAKTYKMYHVILQWLMPRPPI